MKSYKKINLSLPTLPSNRTMKLYVFMSNPLEFDFKGKTYREKTFKELLDQAIQEGRDGVIFNNTWDGGPLFTEDLAARSKKEKQIIPSYLHRN